MMNHTIELPHGLPAWLREFVTNTLDRNEFLIENGAVETAKARRYVLAKLIEAAKSWLEEEVNVAEAAELTGTSEETIRRAVRTGKLPNRRSDGKGRHRVRRGDLAALEKNRLGKYDPIADAQGIAKLRREG